ncbi:hypothetical protein MARLIPOL_18100 [Marinobacter lipolyticus SM19]|uniref:SPOR domain-containing protein n=1 Tax=Marinobacter lipolyticus SM19 TaxID=1318628 RepID=R8AW73_9GAMM|nr:hypothetical protein [Marinobacter lipolyticus]EON90571.1 hypothetical protein MARLIPOL_18100 [Marinobacter lipolyticus SM19]
MKWLALILLVANAALWYYGSSPQTPSRGVGAGDGKLPRVATLKPEAEGSAVTPEPAPSPSLLYCGRLGWFESEADLNEMAATLGMAQDEYIVERRERELAPLHWVLIPPQPADQARKMFRDIQRRGIDSYLVTEGESRNAISLGLFESREAAVSVLEEKNRQNLNAVLAIFPRNQISYALSFEAGLFDDSEQAEALEADYSEDFDFVEIKRCEGIATLKKSP